MMSRFSSTTTSLALLAHALFLAATLLCVRTPAQADPSLALWPDDADYALCHLTIPPGQSRTWRIVAHTSDLDQLQGASFRVAGWPAGYFHVATPNPLASVALGDPIASNASISFPSCRAPGTVLLYTVVTVNTGGGAGALSIRPRSVGGQDEPCPYVNQCGAAFFTNVCAQVSESFVNQGGGTPASDPSPAHASIDVAVSAQLRWKAGHPGSECAIGNSSHRIYFGTSNQPALVATLDPLQDTTWDPGPLQPATTYYWRIEAIDTGYGIRGPLWSFTTASNTAVESRPWSEIKLLYR